MFKTLFILLLAGHALGDFYLQNDALASKKQESLSHLLLHGLLYALSMLLICLSALSWELALAACAASGLHLLVDGAKALYVKKRHHGRTLAGRAAWRLFYADQLLHLFCLAAVAYLLAARGTVLSPLPFAKRFLQVTGGDGHALLSWLALLLLLFKPANIAIATFLSAYRAESPPEAKDAEKAQDPKQTDKNAGRIIGVLERLVIAALLALQQYAAIGLVLTAKSIARYDRISKEPAFAEYYLLGTLLSTLTAILLSFLL